MKTSLYEEIMAAMHEGNSKEDILSLVNEAEAQIKEEDNATKVSLDEARANYIKAVYDFYNAIGVETTMEGAEAQAKLVETMSNFSNVFKSAASKSEPKINSADKDMSTIFDFLKNM